MNARTGFRSLALALALPLSALFLLPLTASETGRLAGTVTDERGRPVAGARVTLKGARTAGVRTTTTDADGRYRLFSLDAVGPSDLLVEADGMVPLETHDLQIHPDRLTHFDVRLHSIGSHDVLVLIDPSVPQHQTALEGARASLPGPIRTVAMAEHSSWRSDLLASLENPPGAVLAIGEEAAYAARTYVRKVPVVHVMVPDPQAAEMGSGNFCGLPLVAGLEQAVERLQGAAAASKRLGVVYDPSRLSSAIGRLRRIAACSGLTLVTGAAHRPEDVPRALADLAGEDVDSLIILGDPTIWTASNLDRARRFAEEGGRWLLVPDPSMALPAKTITYGVGFREAGVIAGRLVREIVEGRLHPSDIGIVEPGAASP